MKVEDGIVWVLLYISHELFQTFGLSWKGRMLEALCDESRIKIDFIYMSNAAEIRQHHRAAL